MFIYIYQNVILVLSVNEQFVYSAIFLSEKLKPIQLLENTPGAASLKSISLKNHVQHLQLSQDTVVYFRKRAWVWPVTEMLFSLPDLWWKCSHMANMSMLEKHRCKRF